MIFPEQLYRLLASDEQVRWLDPFMEAETLQQAAVLITTPQIVVPARRALIIYSVEGRADPDPVAIANFVQVDIFTASGGASHPLLSNAIPEAVAGRDKHLEFHGGPLVLSAGMRIQTQAVFSAAAAANRALVRVYGLLIPLGNVERL